MSTLTYDIDEYQSYLLASKRSYGKSKKILIVLAVVCFGTGAILLYVNMSIVALLFLVLSFLLYQDASHHQLLIDMLDPQWSLALLINKHTKDLETLRWELKQDADSRAAPRQS